MFKFTLPKWAFIDTVAPSGAVQRMFHVGDGNFVSEIPPLILEGSVPSGEAVEAGPLPLAWDGRTFGDDRAGVLRAVFVFDARSGMDALQAAADAGDVTAITTLQRIKNLDTDLQAAKGH